jgi:alpha-galactosidase
MKTAVSFIQSVVSMAVLSLAFLLFSTDGNAQTPKKLALTPPMGWNSWNRFAGNINETLIRRITDSMVSTGMKDAGYEYIILDDVWMASSRDASGKLAADSARFPGGIKALADYVHSKGLKIGIYEDRGSATCAGYPGSYGHEKIDANTFASWGIDYLKYDNCNAIGDLQTDYTNMRNALDSCGRAIVFSLCSWSFPGTWALSVGNLWRTTGDIADNWLSVMNILNTNATLAQYAGPGHWNDPDMLEVGNGGMTTTEYRVHFSMWAIMAAPLIAGNDVRSMTPAIKSILMNNEVIAVDQDSLGMQGTRVRLSGDQEVWKKNLKDGTRAVALLNRGSSPALISVSWKELGLTGDTAQVRDLWDHVSKGVFYKSYQAAVPAHGVAMLKIKMTSVDATYLSDMAWISAATDSGSVRADKSSGGNPITLSDTTYTKGIGTHATSRILINLSKHYNRFTSSIGVDDESGTSGSVVFCVYADGTKKYNSGVMTGSSATEHIDIDITGTDTLTLETTDAGDGSASDHADWAEAQVIRNNIADTVAPSVPINLSAVAIPPFQKVRLKWTRSTDNVGVLGYLVYTGAAKTATTPDTSYVFDNMRWNTHYVFAVRAEDAVGNISALSDTSGITTGGAPITAYLSDMNWVSASTGWKTVQKDKSIDGNPLQLNGVTYAKGIGTHANSDILYDLGKTFDRFTSDVGVDDEKNAYSTIIFTVYLDGVKVFDSGIMNSASATQQVNIQTTGVAMLRLTVTDAGDGNNSDHADWAGAMVSRDTASSAVSATPDAVPASFRLDDNYPNPFNPTTNISFALSKKSYVSLGIYDVMGREVSVVFSGMLPAGFYTRQWNADNFASGVYFYRLQADSFTQIKKLVLLK